MVRIRKFIVCINRVDQSKLELAINKIESLRVIQKNVVRDLIQFLLSVDREHWTKVEDVLFTSIENDHSSSIGDFTEECLFDEHDFQCAKYFVLLQKINSIVDISYKYNFDKFDGSKGGRPQCWEMGYPYANRKKLNKLKTNMFIGEKDVLLVNDIGRDEFMAKCADQNVYDELFDVSQEPMGWFVVRPQFVMKLYSPESTGVIDKGCPSLRLKGGAREIFDTRGQGYWPAYEEYDLHCMSKLGVHIARTRECYGEWAVAKGDVIFAPQPRVIVSRLMRELLTKHCARYIQFVPIRGVVS